VRLLENEKSRRNHNACILGEDSNGITSPQYFKDKSKKWQKFVAQVVILSMLFIMCSEICSFQNLISGIKSNACILDKLILFYFYFHLSIHLINSSNPMHLAWRLQYFPSSHGSS
jgi:hypothetical protein